MARRIGALALGILSLAAAVAAHECGYSHPGIAEHLSREAVTVPQSYSTSDGKRQLQVAASTFVAVTEDTAQRMRIKLVWDAIDGIADSTRVCKSARSSVMVPPSAVTTDATANVTCTEPMSVPSGGDRRLLMELRTKWGVKLWSDVLSLVPIQDPITISDAALAGIGIDAASFPSKTHNETDLVLIMTARPSPNAPIAGYAQCLQRNQWSRCTVGQFNWIPEVMSPETVSSPGTIAAERHTAVHEIGHVLGAIILGPHFINQTTGEPVNHRDLAVVEQDSADYDKQALKIKTPRVLALAREHFACPTLTGVALEDLPLGKGAHWEARIMGPEVMSYGSAVGEVYVSDLTLAFLEDTNQYLADKTKNVGRLLEGTTATALVSSIGFLKTKGEDLSGYTPPPPPSPGALTWGRKAGCDFVTKSLAYWPERYTCTQHGEQGCSFDNKASAVCQLDVGARAPRYFSSGNYLLDATGRYVLEPNLPGLQVKNDACNANTDSGCPLPTMQRYFGSHTGALAPADGSSLFPDHPQLAVAVGAGQTTGGVSSALDFAPTRVKYWNCRNAKPASVAGSRGAQEGASVNASLFASEDSIAPYGGQEHCTNCRCFISSLLEITAGFNPYLPTFGLCYRSNCVREDYLQVALTGAVSDTINWYKCPSGGGKLYIFGYTGALHCPKAEEFCRFEEVTGIQYPETSLLGQFILYGILGGLLVLALLACATPCWRDRIVMFFKFKCGVMHFDPYAEEYRTKGVAEEHKILVMPYDGYGNPLRYINFVTLAAGVVGVILAAYFLAVSGASPTSLLTLEALSVGMVVVSVFGIVGSRKVSYGTSCVIITYFFATAAIVMCQLYGAVRLFVFTDDYEPFVEKNWESYCAVTKSADYCQSTATSETVRAEAVADAADTIEGNMQVAAGIVVVFIVLYLVCMILSAYIMEKNIVVGTSFTVLNNFSIIFGLVLVVTVSVFTLRTEGAGSTKVAAAALLALGLFVVLLGIAGHIGAFRKHRRWLKAHMLLTFIAFAFSASVAGVCLTQADSIVGKVDSATDEEVATGMQDWGMAMTREELKVAMRDSLKSTGIACIVAAVAFFSLMLCNSSFRGFLKMYAILHPIHGKADVPTPRGSAKDVGLSSPPPWSFSMANPQVGTPARRLPAAGRGTPPSALAVKVDN